MRKSISDHKQSLSWIACAMALLSFLPGSALGQNPVVYTKQVNPSAPGVTSANSYDTGQTWASQVCSPENPPAPLPAGSELEWAPILDPKQDAETHLVAVSGTMVYDPDPRESGFCQGGSCPGQPIACTGNSFDCFSACGGFCDLGQGPSCSGGSCPSPFTDPQVGAPVACTSDAQCGTCGGTCSAKGRSRGDMQMTHPFGFDYDASIAPDPAYYQLLSPGNVESTHLDPTDVTAQTALDGFGGQVYPWLHATTGLTEGWCTPDFKQRCSATNPCASGTCEGIVPGFGVNPGSLPGVLGVETDHDLLPESYQPLDGDRTAMFGRWIVDCGHGDEDGDSGWHTEIHPPLLIASGRSNGSGFFGANCSGEQTCSNVIGRPFLVSQNFGDGFFAKHLENEIEKLGCVEVTGPLTSAGIALEGPFEGLPDCNEGLDVHCVCNGDLGCEACELASCATLDACLLGVPFTCGASPPPFGAPCSLSVEERPQVNGVPFTGTQEMQYFVQPANGRINPGDRMVAKWHMTTRTGVSVAISGAGDAGVLVDVSMDASSYKKADLPSKQDWVVDPGKITPDFSFAGLGKLLLDVAAPIQSSVANQGLFTDRYDAPGVPGNDASPVVGFADQLSGSAQADNDDTQVFPLSGRINVGWFRCNTGGPYVAECTGPTTTVNLNGTGSRDPDGNPISYGWTGGFVGGTATGQTVPVQYPGTGTSALNLTVADTDLSNTCSTTVKVQDTTPPLIDINQPMATTYTHSSLLTLNYTVTDVCTGVASFTPTMDGATTLDGHGLQSGQPIKLLTEMTLGPHVFNIGAVDNAGNADTKSVTFTIIVTADSIKDDVTEFLASGDIKNNGIANSLLAKLDAAENARNRGNCNTAANQYSAFINELLAQSGKGVSTTAVAIMIADAQYLITHCP